MVVNLRHAYVAAFAILAIAIPKSGVAISGIPLNGIYLLICLSLPFLVAKFLVRGTTSGGGYDVYVLLLFPFWMLFLTITLMNGIAKPPAYVGYVMSLVVVPLFFYLWSCQLSPDKLQYLLRAMVWCVRFAAAFGILLFLYKIATGQYFSIPLLTTTLGADQTLESRMNDRGGIFKLFSTYNNGNIYAVCMIMLLPVYSAIEKSRKWIVLLMLTIMLTLSRTAWALLLLYCIFEYLVFNKAVSVKKLILICVLLCVVVPGMIALLGVMGKDLGFLFDAGLGGRASYLAYFFNAGFISHVPLYWSYEIPYVSIAEFVGLIGLLPFLMFFSNIMLARSLFNVNRPVSRGACIGCVMYGVATFSDAALILVPTFIIYSLLVMLSFSE